MFGNAACTQYWKTFSYSYIEILFLILHFIFQPQKLGNVRTTQRPLYFLNRLFKHDFYTVSENLFMWYSSKMIDYYSNTFVSPQFVSGC